MARLANTDVVTRLADTVAMDEEEERDREETLKEMGDHLKRGNHEALFLCLKYYWTIK